MTLEDLCRLLEHYRGSERDDAPVFLVHPSGADLPLLSISWDSEDERWALVGDIDA